MILDDLRLGSSKMQKLLLDATLVIDLARVFVVVHFILIKVPSDLASNTASYAAPPQVKSLSSLTLGVVKGKECRVPSRGGTSPPACCCHGPHGPAQLSAFCHNFLLRSANENRLVFSHRRPPHRILGLGKLFQGNHSSDNNNFNPTFLPLSCCHLRVS